MKIAVLSGKGGTGKTLVSVNLAAVADKAVYIDCDVEEPNGYLFFKPTSIDTKKVTVQMPYAKAELCNGCRKCVNFCKFNALAYIANQLIVFDKVCHSCGGCALLCPKKAIFEKEKEIAEIQKGVSGNVTVITGILKVGELSGVPVIKMLLDVQDADNELTLIDCPPGSACIVMESIQDADYCILVAEPTLFGAHNLKMVHELATLFHKPHGVVLNKCLDGQNPSEELCRQEDIKILGEIPYDEVLGLLNSKALIAVRENDKYNKLFDSLLQTVIKEAQHETVVNS